MTVHTLLRRAGRWQLALRVAPLIGVLIVVKLVLDRIGWEGLSINPLYSSLVAAVVFLLGFLLVGTLSDFKESERLPGELAASLETTMDECLIIYESKQAAAALECLEHLHRLVGTLRRWFNERASLDEVLDAISGLNRYFLAFESLTQPNFIVRLKQEQSAVRRIVTRIHMIRETSFVGAGYAIAELASLLLLVALVLMNLDGLGQELLLVSLVAFVLVYMILLIRDLDDPFDYTSGRGVAEVSLHPIDHLEERISQSIGRLSTDPSRALGTDQESG